MTEPILDLWPWLVTHRAERHVAMYLRGLVAGDFRPGVPILSNYAMYPDGSLPAPEENPRCGTCHQALLTDDVDVIARHYAPKDWLAPYRQGGAAWPQGTRLENCRGCNRAPSSSHKHNYVHSDGIARPNIFICCDCAGHAYVRSAQELIDGMA